MNADWTCSSIACSTCSLIACSCRYCLWVIFRGLNRLRWVAFVPTMWLLLHFKTIISKDLWPPWLPDVRYPNFFLFFGLLEGGSVQKWTSHCTTLQRQHLTDQHWAWCSAAYGGQCASCSNMSTGWRPFSTLHVLSSSSAWMHMCHLSFI